MSADLKESVGRLGLRDAWREFRGDEEGHTFLSGVHGSQSRIDYIWVSVALVGAIREVCTGPIGIADHKIVSLEMDVGQRRRGIWGWKLPVSILRDPLIRKDIEEKIKLFFDTNKREDTGEDVRWDAFKATLRGELIAISAHRVKQLQVLESQLEAEVEAARQAAGDTPSRRAMREYRRAVGQLELLCTKKAEGALLSVQQQYYAKANRTGSLLARLLRDKRLRNAITALRSPMGERVTNQEGVQEAFAEYYESLYASQHPSGDKQEDFLQRIHLREISSAVCEVLNREIAEEVRG